MRVPVYSLRRVMGTHEQETRRAGFREGALNVSPKAPERIG
jgi:hypothetical protein